MVDTRNRKPKLFRKTQTSSTTNPVRPRNLHRGPFFLFPSRANSFTLRPSPQKPASPFPALAAQSGPLPPFPGRHSSHDEAQRCSPVLSPPHQPASRSRATDWDGQPVSRVPQRPHVPPFLWLSGPARPHPLPHPTTARAVAPFGD